MYKCDECGAVFDTPSVERTGVSYAGFYETENVCPGCGSTNYDPAQLCDYCGEYFTDVEAFEGCCKHCYDEARKALDRFLDGEAAGMYEKHRKIIKDFLTTI